MRMRVGRFVFGYVRPQHIVSLEGTVAPVVPGYRGHFDESYASAIARPQDTWLPIVSDCAAVWSGKADGL
jgi:hypothetical protein